MSTRARTHEEPAENGASGSYNNNNNFNSAMREAMFEKVLTPSDVGKLNRLVIPKQHAENYFPLEDNQTGTLLDFQERNGKNVESYVMTKGWSRFVKEKKLNNGDTVSFHRGYENEPKQRRNILFIEWRHRPDTNLEHNINHHHYAPPYPWNLGRSEPFVYDSYPVFPTTRVASFSSMLPPSQPPQEGTAKKLRLFGFDVEESSSSGEARCEMGVAGHSSSSPVVIRADESSWRSPRGEMGGLSSSVVNLSDDEEYKMKEKSLEC
ncbi:hypothetical protein N665_0463s0017 [Sinapis alba]|nr:hypothetical protein N665_0463s0017 [Sinapis alba]